MAETGEATLAWENDRNSWAEVAAFFARTISRDADYISHGEIQAGLSLDGTSWSPDLADRFLAGLGSNKVRSLIVARNTGGEIIAAANVAWSFDTADIPFATLDDMAVDPGFRSRGLGKKLYDAVEEEARARGVKWIFLESGTNNTRAHAFFERLGLVEVSRVFAKRL